MQQFQEISQVNDGALSALNVMHDQYKTKNEAQLTKNEVGQIEALTAGTRLRSFVLAGTHFHSFVLVYAHRHLFALIHTYQHLLVLRYQHWHPRINPPWVWVQV